MADVLPMLFVVAAGACLSLVLLAFWSSLRGLFEHAGERAVKVQAPSRRAALVREKDELLAAIRELRFEHELGKVSSGDLERLERQYRARAREVLRELDEQIAPYRERARDMIHAAVQGSAVAEPSAAPTGAPAESAEVGQAGPREVNTCAKCDTRNDADALFCKKCGTAIRAGAAS